MSSYLTTMKQARRLYVRLKAGSTGVSFRKFARFSLCSKGNESAGALSPKLRSVVFGARHV